SSSTSSPRSWAKSSSAGGSTGPGSGLQRIEQSLDQPGGLIADLVLAGRRAVEVGQERELEAGAEQQPGGRAGVRAPANPAATLLGGQVAGQAVDRSLRAGLEYIQLVAVGGEQFLRGEHRDGDREAGQV